MFVIFAGLVGVLAALFIHWLTWYMRLNHLSITAIAGALSAVGLTSSFVLLLSSDIANMIRIVLIILWLVALGLGYLQARSLPAPWWKGIAAVFLEGGLAFLLGAAVNLTLQRYIGWLDQQFPGIDVYAIIDAFLRALLITFLVLAVVRPLVRLYRPRVD